MTPFETLVVGNAQKALEAFAIDWSKYRAECYLGPNNNEVVWIVRGKGDSLYRPRIILREFLLDREGRIAAMPNTVKLHMNGLDINARSCTER